MILTRCLTVSHLLSIFLFLNWACSYLRMLFLPVFDELMLSHIHYKSCIYSYRSLSHSNLLQDGINPFGGDLSSCSCNVCCFGDYGCPLVPGFLHCDVSAPGSSSSLPRSLSLYKESWKTSAPAACSAALPKN